MIDAHQHLWRIGENDCTWPTPELEKIYRNFDVSDLQPLVMAAGVTGTVLVQSQMSDKDTDSLLALASQHDLIKAVVGWVDLASPDAVARIRELTKHPKMRGLRPMLQGLADDCWILRPQIEAAIVEMKAQALSFDALIFPRHLPVVQEFAMRHEDLAIVIDHGAKPNIASGGFDEWAEHIARIAQLPNVSCKLSGLVTESAVHQGITELRIYAEHIFREFGASRIMWGSDWPVVNLASNPEFASYQDWINLARQLLTLSPAEEQAVFVQNAKNFYRF